MKNHFFKVDKYQMILPFGIHAGALMITIVPYQTTWPNEFLTLGTILRQTLGDLAQRIDHIGSTSVSDLAAKDIIDIQISALSFDPAIELALNRAGYQRIEHITQDHLPPRNAHQMSNWMKWIFKPSSSQRPVNVHVRLLGQANQRYPLLFRDYLRANPATAEAYGQVKCALAKYHGHDIDAYYDIKDPVCDIIIGGAEVWAKTTQWKAEPTDC
jgi:GrpB-like predicted nucleotidyltransferase (UPF0157 family)